MKSRLYVLLFISSVALSNVKIEQLGNMKVVQYYPPYIAPAATASAMATALKRQPLESKVTFLDVPWSEMVNHRKVPLANVIPAVTGPCFTICYHEGWKSIMPYLKRIGVTHLFITQARPGMIWRGIKILPIPYIPHRSHRVAPSPKKDLLYSFIGYESHRVRYVLFQSAAKTKKRDKLVKKRTHWGPKVGLVTREKWRKEYCSAIARSRFGLCPRGNSPNTIRLLEVMHGGAVPLIYANELCLPVGVAWQECMIRVPENKMNMVDNFVRTIPPVREQALRERGIAVARAIMADPACFIRYYFDRAPIMIEGEARA